MASRRGRPARVARAPSGRPARVAGTPCCALPSASFACRAALPGGHRLARSQPASYSSPWFAQWTLRARCCDSWAPAGRPARVAGTPCCAAPAASDVDVNGPRGRKELGKSWRDRRGRRADMCVNIHANRFTRAQTHAQSGSLVLRLADSQALVIKPIVFFRVVYPATCRRAPSRGSWPHREPHRRRVLQLRYSQLHMVGSFARLIVPKFCCESSLADIRT